MRRPALFRGTTSSALWYLTLVVIVPLASLSVLGLLYLWQQDRLLPVLLAWLCITLVAYGAFIAWPRRRKTAANRSPAAGILAGGGSARPGRHTTKDNAAVVDDDQLPERLDEKSDWTEQDRALWRLMCTDIESRLLEALPWQSLPDQSLQLLSAISARYHPVGKSVKVDKDGKTRLEYRFTLPEALLVLSVASERYRKVILQHVPFAERVTVATLVKLYDRQQHIRTGYTWLNTARRTLRLANPIAAAIGELRDQFTNRVFEHLSTNVQKDLKRLLLQEVVQVGIDLYSGKLKSSVNELDDYRSKAYTEDLQRKALAAEPLRIVLAGQTSAGKSSLVNALADTLHAEVGILPTTESNVIHSLQLDDAAPLHLIDTIGLANTQDGLASLTQLATDADMILMVIRANQPARAPDQQLWNALQKTFAAMPRRRVPPLMLVMTHIDQLTPRAEWNPPYDLDSDSRKAASINGALRSALKQIGLPEGIAIIPVCLSPDKGLYNVDAVAAQVMMLQDSATLTQLNRRRVELGEQAISWRERWQQVRRLGLVIGRAAISSSAGDTNDTDDA